MQALELRTALGDRWGIAMSENNIGQIACLQHDYGAARSHLEQGLRTALEVGDLWLIGLVHHSLGNTQRDLGDSTAARHNYAEALRRYSLIGSKWDLSTLFEDVAIQELDAEPRAALRLIGAGEAVRQELGSPRSSAQQAELDEKLSGARARLGEDAERELAAGHGLSPAQAQDLALEVCEKDR